MIKDFDSTKWQYDVNGDLRWVGGNQRCDLPKGVTSCYRMFSECKLSKGFYFGNFDTCHVHDMSMMFFHCRLPEDFTLGNNFDTSGVTDMYNMFDGCIMPEGFTLGDNFDTSSVTDMSEMFLRCHLPKGFNLGDKFDTRNVTQMRSMFRESVIPEGFSLGQYFVTPKVKDMSYMFYQCELPSGFSLGGGFMSNELKEMHSMFEECKGCEGLHGSPYFKLPAYVTLEDVFGKSSIPDNFLDNLTSLIVMPQYDYTRLHDVPIATLSTCKTEEDILKVIRQFCKL